MELEFREEVLDEPELLDLLLDLLGQEFETFFKVREDFPNEEDA